MDVKQKVCEVLGEFLDEPTENIEGSDRLVGDLELDSLEIVEVGMQLEDALGIEIPDAVFDGDITVAELVEKVSQLIPL